jgi:PIN domain nuclease of toxin-antitoxin system
VQPISWFVIRRANQFPWHNPDPFDRYIAAEALTRLSTDPKLDRCGVERAGE